MNKNDVNFNNKNNYTDIHNNQPEINSHINNTNPNEFHLIKSITKHFEITDFEDNEVQCFTELSDLRIAIGCHHSLFLYIIDPFHKQYTQITHQENAHKSYIEYLTEINKTKLASCSRDGIKIWDTSNTAHNLLLITTLGGINYWALQLLTLTDNRIASLSKDKSIKIWNSDSYEQIGVIDFMESKPCCFIQLKHHVEMLICVSVMDVTNENESCVEFYNANAKYEKKGVVNKAYTGVNKGMVELYNGNVALTRILPSPCKIIIVDPVKFEIVSEIVNEEILNDNGMGSLWVFDKYSFCYASRGCFCQVRYNDDKEYKICFMQKEKKEELNGYGLIFINNNNYFITNTFVGDKINIYKCNY